MQFTEAQFSTPYPIDEAVRRLNRLVERQGFELWPRDRVTGTVLRDEVRLRYRRAWSRSLGELEFVGHFVQASSGVCLVGMFVSPWDTRFVKYGLVGTGMILLALGVRGLITQEAHDLFQVALLLGVAAVIGGGLLHIEGDTPWQYDKPAFMVAIGEALA